MWSLGILFNELHENYQSFYIEVKIRSYYGRLIVFFFLDRASPHHPGEEARSGPDDMSAVRGHAHGMAESRVLGLHTDPGERP